MRGDGDGHFAVETLAEKRTGCWVSEESLIPVMMCRQRLQSGSGAEEAQSERGGASEDQRNLIHAWPHSVRAHTRRSVLMPAVTPNVAFIIIPSSFRLIPSRSDSSRSCSCLWRHIMCRWPNLATASLLQDKNSTVAACSFLGNSSRRCFSLQLYALFGWKMSVVFLASLSPCDN